MTPDPVHAIERDPLGEHAVPADAYYGIQTARAVENFPISGLRAPAELVTATVLVKKAAAQANVALGRLDRARRRAPSCRPRTRSSAARSRDQFVVDVYQAGAGTSHNMNANEVLANRAAELLGGATRRVPARAPERSRQHGPVHQRRVSDGDAAGAAARARRARRGRARAGGVARRARPTRSTSVLKVGRTHLQDAVPITLGQEFGGYAACIERGADDVEHARRTGLQELNLGATAVGTGLNAGDDYTTRAVANIGTLYWHRRSTPAANRFRVTQSMGDVLAYSGAMRRLAVELSKIASDLRLLSMGPRAGLERDHAAGGAAGLVDHAGQGQPVGSRDGEPGVLTR